MRTPKADVVLIGGGIMSTTLAMLIHSLDPSRRIVLLEQASQLGLESSDGWNNAGTGHAGYCELNYTPMDSLGAVDISRALDINARFEVSLQFWASLVRRGVLPAGADFINAVPHLSWVTGAEGVQFLRKRQQALAGHALFADMQFSDRSAELARWLPLMQSAVSQKQPCAATRVADGTDVDFGALTRALGEALDHRNGVTIRTDCRVTGLRRQSGGWRVSYQDAAIGGMTELDAGFVFVGAGGAALKLLQKSGIPEIRGYGGFPVSGLWLASDNPRLAMTHHAKVYGLPPVGAPPMSVPHLDTRLIGGKPALLFGPFAGFTTRFLKQGSTTDLVSSLRTHNLRPMLDVALSQWPLTRYLLREGTSRFEDRMTQLRQFLPEADAGQWRLVTAGQRVQIIKRNKQGRGVLEFGTEVVASADGRLAGLLGASPGASTSVSAMLSVIERCLPELTTGVAGHRLRALIPSYGKSLVTDASLLADVRRYSRAGLGLDHPQPTWPDGHGSDAGQTDSSAA
ncbi:MAG: malate dehydrogenase (quinone) [Marinobacter sp.]|nr:malate dehydrogenase (quinone) [Marinobacter sp.]